MAWRKSHGTGAGGGPRIEPLPANELQHPKPAKLAKGGAMKIKLARALSLGGVPNEEWAPYLELAERFRKHQCKALAQQAGGFCGAAPSSMIASAALQLAASRFMFDLGARQGDMQLVKMGSTCANESRQNLLAAYELAIREADARQRYRTHDPHRALAAALVEDIPELKSDSEQASEVIESEACSPNPASSLSSALSSPSAATDQDQDQDQDPSRRRRE
jgi:hypothetical protein